jgi:hypothetical protein
MCLCSQQELNSREDLVVFEARFEAIKFVLVKPYSQRVLSQVLLSPRRRVVLSELHFPPQYRHYLKDFVNGKE